MAEAVQSLKYADIESAFGTLPPLIGRPNVYNIRAIEEECMRKAGAIDNPALPNRGYLGLVTNPIEYEQYSPGEPWIDPPNPGAAPNYTRTGPAGQPIELTDTERAQIKADHEAAKIVWENANTVHRVVKAALNKAIPNTYQPSQLLGQRGFGSLTARQIFRDLYERYGQIEPEDTHKILFALYKDWNPAQPIEVLLNHIEQQQIFAIAANRPLSNHQIIDAAVYVIQGTKLFQQELKDYREAHPDSAATTWPEFKAYWIDAYAKWDRHRNTTQSNGYHGIHSTTTTAPSSNDDSESIASLVEAFGSIQTERSQQNLALQALSQQVSQIMQQLANNQTSSQASIPSQVTVPPMVPPMMPTAPAPTPVPSMVPPMIPSAPMYPPAPPAMPNMYAYNMTPVPATHCPPPPPPARNTNYNGGNNGYNNNRGGGRGNGRNSNNRGRSNNGRGRNNTPHPVKRYENWFYCSSCGFDTAHQSNACDRQKMGHIPNLTREMKIHDMYQPEHLQQYRNASYAGRHKTILPSQAAANGYPQYQCTPGYGS